MIYRLGLCALMVGVCFALPPSAKAQDLRSELQKCGSVSDNMARLQCYDSIVKQNSMSNDGSASSGTGKEVASPWLSHQENNPMDDTNTVMLADIATSGTDRMGDAPRLYIRCMSKQLDVYIVWGDFLGEDHTDTELRIGNRPAIDESWSNSTDKEAAFSPNPLALVEALVNSDRLVAQVTPYNESPIIATFDVSGLSSAILPLAKDCKLKL